MSDTIYMYALITQRGHEAAIIEGIPDARNVSTCAEALTLLGREGFRVVAQTSVFDGTHGALVRSWTLERKVTP